MIRLFLFLILGLSAFAQTRGNYVVIISIDGFAAYAWKDPALPVPNLRKLAAGGAAAEAMEPVNPTVTWPNHTSMVTGVLPARHGVIYNGQAVRTGEGKPLKVDPWVVKDEMVAAPTLYDLAHAAKLTTSEVDWVAIHKSRTITWAFPEVPSPEGAVEREMMAGGLVTAGELRRFRELPIYFRDEIWTRAAEHLITRHKPNLLLFHLLTTDSLQHAHGARSPAGYTALALADARVGRLMDALQRAGISSKTTVFIVSDHGFKTVRHQIHANAVLATHGLADDAWVIPEGGTAMFYATRASSKEATIAKARSAFQGVQGIARVLDPSGFSAFGYPSPANNNRMADLVLAAADGYAFGGATSGPDVVPVAAGASPGSHGYLSSDPDMAAIFIASGRGIRKGVTLPKVRNIDVAPTAARLLGLKFEKTDGEVLAAILE